MAGKDSYDKSHRVHVGLSPELKAKVKAYAATLGLDVSPLLRTIIKQLDLDPSVVPLVVRVPKAYLHDKAKLTEYLDEVRVKLGEQLGE